VIPNHDPAIEEISIIDDAGWPVAFGARLHQLLLQFGQGRD
jgi:hypothetical protein